MYTTNYKNTFIETAEDCPVSKAEIPQIKNDKITIAKLQYDLISKNPYKYTSDDVIFLVYAERNNIPQAKYEDERKTFFSRGQPCMRSSPLAKRYGWGVHSNENGKIAIYPAESDKYKAFLKDSNINHKKAMRSKRK